MNRTYRNGELSIKNLNETVTLIGWVAKRRNLGSILFVDLRDRSGIVQILINEDVKAPDIRNEYIIEVTGVVNKRANANPNLKTGEIEVIATV